jgi:hypothetical protein
MTSIEPTSVAPSAKTRAERVISHALVEIRRHRWLPFGIKSAVLLDLSDSGFKAEFTGATVCRPGETRYIHIPLSPFGIKAPTSITCPVIIKWFDPEKMRVGGVFDHVSSTTQIYLTQIIDAVKTQGLGG